MEELQAQLERLKVPMGMALIEQNKDFDEQKRALLDEYRQTR